MDEWDILYEIHQDRVREENDERIIKQETGEFIWQRYVVWQRYFGKELNTETFKEFLLEDKIELTERQRMNILKNHFGYNFKWNYEKEKWEVKKDNQKICEK